MNGASLSPKQMLGPYEVVAHLGGGGFGEVYRVRHVRVGGEYALKVCNERLTSQRAIASFQREALLANAVGKASRHVARVHEAGVDPGTGRPWFVMDFIEGVSLARWLKRNGPLPTRDALRVLTDVAHALEAAHAVGIIHCDLKPENVMLHKAATSDARIMATLVDFGIARALGSALGGSTSTVAGTLQWMAPEQLEGGAVGYPTDVWAFGRLAYLLVVGEMFSSRRQGHDEPARLARANKRAVPDEFDEWFARACHESSGERTQSIASALQGLRGVFSLADASQSGAASAAGNGRGGASTVKLGVIVVALAAVPFAAWVGVNEWAKRGAAPTGASAGATATGAPAAATAVPADRSNAGAEPTRQRDVTRAPLAAHTTQTNGEPCAVRVRPRGSSTSIYAPRGCDRYEGYADVCGERVRATFGDPRIYRGTTLLVSAAPTRNTFRCDGDERHDLQIVGTISAIPTDDPDLMHECLLRKPVRAFVEHGELSVLPCGNRTLHEQIVQSLGALPGRR